MHSDSSPCKQVMLGASTEKKVCLTHKLKHAFSSNPDVHVIMLTNMNTW